MLVLRDQPVGRATNVYVYRNHGQSHVWRKVVARGSWEPYTFPCISRGASGYACLAALEGTHWSEEVDCFAAQGSAEQFQQAYSAEELQLLIEMRRRRDRIWTCLQ